MLYRFQKYSGTCWCITCQAAIVLSNMGRRTGDMLWCRVGTWVGFLAGVAFCSVGCQTGTEASEPARVEPIVGAWRAQVQFETGPFAEVKDLEFFYVFHADGTMTESSNYDGAPPVPPAYGMWRRAGTSSFEAHYEYFNSKPPAKFEDIAKGGGWTPGGRGTIKEKLTFSSDGLSFESTMDFVLRDPSGKEIPGGGRAVAKGRKLTF